MCLEECSGPSSFPSHIHVPSPPKHSCFLMLITILLCASICVYSNFLFMKHIFRFSCLFLWMNGDWLIYSPKVDSKISKNQVKINSPNASCLWTISSSASTQTQQHMWGPWVFWESNKQQDIWQISKARSAMNKPNWTEEYKKWAETVGFQALFDYIYQGILLYWEEKYIF